MDNLSQQIPSLIFGAIIGATIGFLFAKLAFRGEILEARKQARKQSRAVILGEVNEKVAPLLPGFPYDFKDMVFIGKGIDYLVFDGLSRGNLQQIILLEIKSGSSRLNHNETSIRECISRGKICYEVFRINY